MTSGLYLILVIFSAFSMNLSLQCALGVKSLAESKTYTISSSLIKLLLMFFSMVILWVFFSRVIFSLFYGISMFILVFPVSFLAYEGLSFLVFEILLKGRVKSESFIDFDGGITSVAVFICLNIANVFSEAVFLSFGFVFGIFLVIIILREIRKRASLEPVPRFFRGKPLVLVTMGMLSLVFSAVSLIILRMISIR